MGLTRREEQTTTHPRVLCLGCSSCSDLFSCVCIHAGVNANLFLVLVDSRPAERAATGRPLEAAKVASEDEALNRCRIEISLHSVKGALNVSDLSTQHVSYVRWGDQNCVKPNKQENNSDKNGQ